MKPALIAAAVLVALVGAGLAVAQHPQVPQELLMALWSTCYADAWVRVGEYELTCFVRKVTGV